VHARVATAQRRPLKHPGTLRAARRRAARDAAVERPPRGAHGLREPRRLGEGRGRDRSESSRRRRGGRRRLRLVRLLRFFLRLRRAASGDEGARPRGVPAVVRSVLPRTRGLEVPREEVPHELLVIERPVLIGVVLFEHRARDALVRRVDVDAEQRPLELLQVDLLVRRQAPALGVHAAQDAHRDAAVGRPREQRRPGRLLHLLRGVEGGHGVGLVVERRLRRGGNAHRAHATLLDVALLARLERAHRLAVGARAGREGAPGVRGVPGRWRIVRASRRRRGRERGALASLERRRRRIRRSPPGRADEVAHAGGVVVEHPVRVRGRRGRPRRAREASVGGVVVRVVDAASLGVVSRRLVDRERDAFGLDARERGGGGGGVDRGEAAAVPRQGSRACPRARARRGTARGAPARTRTRRIRRRGRTTRRRTRR
jgi:hypothetical protein